MCDWDKIEKLLDDMDSVRVTQAGLLPAGWMWNDYGDGSGCLASPEGHDYFQYDLCTGEYRYYDSKTWHLFDDWPSRMDLRHFKGFAEKEMLKLLKSREEEVYG